MNVFVVDEDPVRAARDLCDQHVVKMPLETAQMVSTVLVGVGVDSADLYRPTHRAHPCTLWAGSTRDNFAWLLDHGFALCDEYKARYNKEHASRRVLLVARVFSERLQAGEKTPFAQALPEKYRASNAVEAYRAYYRGEKAAFARWNHSEKPAWW